jgi:pimeloyl-ACP methyl ester carboxylesterase
MIKHIKCHELTNKHLCARYLNTDDYGGGFEKADIEKTLSQISSDYHVWAENLVSLTIGGYDHDPDPVFIEKLKRSYLTMRPEVAHSLVCDIFLKDRREVLEKVEVPCTIITTSNDIVAPVGVCSYMQNKIKRESTLEIIDAEGHCPQITAHHKFIEVLERVLLPKNDNERCQT